jgi:transposase-like protein
MEDSRIPMRHWCWAFWQLCSSKKGISAKQIQRQTGLSYKSALFLLHRVRFAMADMEGVRLSGTVEADESYIGGKPRIKGPHNKRGRGTAKQPIFSMVERGGRVTSRVVADVTASTLKGAIREVVDSESRIMTDELNSYRGIGTEFAGGHRIVRHSIGEYSRGEAHCNTAESVFALVKRGMYGVYHNVSKRHLHRYLAEFDYRWNSRKIDDGERTIRAMKRGEGKRLMYREPVAWAS